MESANTPAEAKAAVSKVLEVLSNTDQAALADLFPYWRVQEAYKTEDASKQQAKITMAINPMARTAIKDLSVGLIRAALIDGFRAHGIMLIPGAAPRPKVERAVQDNLNKHQGNKR